jgi:two-component system, OmpR family, sensor histidine kinase QseC
MHANAIAASGASFRLSQQPYYHYPVTIPCLPSLSAICLITPSATVLNTALLTSYWLPAITITNPGNGVAPENLQRLRERFFRPAGQKARGSGLGLSIVDSIAQLHGLKFGINDIKNKLGQRVGLQVEIHN